MSHQEDTEQDQGLHSHLQAWRADAELPPRFKEEVWRRIGRREEHRPSLWGEWWRVIAGQRVWAGVYVGVVVVIGVGAGFARSQNYREQAERTWQAAYVESVSPMLQTDTQP